MANLTQGWISHLRRQAKKYVSNVTRAHSARPLKTMDAPVTDDSHSEAPGNNPKEPPPSSPEDEAKQAAGDDDSADVDPRQPGAPTASVDAADTEDVARARKKLRSPTTSVDAGDRNRSPSPVRRSKAKYAAKEKEMTSDSIARPAPKGRLWREGDPPMTSRPAAAPTQQNTRTSRRHASKSIGQEVEQEDPSVTHMIKQPETRPISQEQLVAEVKGIYAGLVMYAIWHIYFFWRNY